MRWKRDFFLTRELNDDDKQLEEERRLLFVGITRAQRELYLSRCRIRTFRGQQQATSPSRFLKEFPSEPLEIHDRSGVAPPQRVADGSGGWWPQTKGLCRRRGPLRVSFG